MSTLPTSEPAADPRVRQIVDATAAGFEACARTRMPAGEYRDFCLWAIDGGNPLRDRFLQLTGILQLANLTTRLLDGLVTNDRAWNHLVEASRVMNGWQILEVVSDNLAIGLGHPPAADTSFETARRNLLYAFNAEMVLALAGSGKSAGALAELFAGMSGDVSLFAHSLSPEKHAAFADAYTGSHPAARWREIDFGAHIPLAANIASCCEVADNARVAGLDEIVRTSLARRYETVSRLLDYRPIDPAELIDISTYTILVMPTLGYYISNLYEAEGAAAKLAPVAADGTLSAALYDAAMLVRKLNDLGTAMVLATWRKRQDVISALRLSIERAARPITVNELLLEAADREPLLNRIRKDALLDEFNVSLYGIGHESADRESIDYFGHRLEFAAGGYLEQRLRLDEELAVIDRRIGDTRAGALVRRFVRFHEALYSERFDSTDGEYAILCN